MNLMRPSWILIHRTFSTVQKEPPWRIVEHTKLLRAICCAVQLATCFRNLMFKRSSFNNSNTSNQYIHLDEKFWGRPLFLVKVYWRLRSAIRFHSMYRTSLHLMSLKDKNLSRLISSILPVNAIKSRGARVRLSRTVVGYMLPFVRLFGGWLSNDRV